MTQPMHKQLRAIGELLKLDCGDSSCLSAPQHGGMRTNGGCRCDFVAAVVRLQEQLEWHVALVKAFQDNQQELVQQILAATKNAGS